MFKIYHIQWVNESDALFQNKSFNRAHFTVQPRSFTVNSTRNQTRDSFFLQTCFTEVDNVPDFQFRLEIITNVSGFHPAVGNQTLDVPHSKASRGGGSFSLHNGSSDQFGMNHKAYQISLRSNHAPQMLYPYQKSVAQESAQAMEKNGLSILNRAPVTTNSSTAAPVAGTGMAPYNNTQRYGDKEPPDQMLSQSHQRMLETTTDSRPLELTQEVKYCFLQKTVTTASVMVAVAFTLSLLLILFTVLTRCKRSEQANLLVSAELPEHI